ncbi:hypothetical protein BKA62DRAFT_701564 [Auriculariales sp. MPI-PUGE-AT-0066]|nr:hypothetical protein BKA62DRAFT_701564 [Auriculariales sp. MPI-PUGE-AT-0066]
MSVSLVDAPLSMLSIPVAWVLAMAPHAQKAFLAVQFKKFNNLAPRGMVDRMQNDSSIDKEAARLAQRLDGAHHNGMEIFPLWAAAITIGNVYKIENRTLNTCSVLFLTSRIVYNRLYATQRTRSDASKRSLAWLFGVAISMYLLIRGPMIQRTSTE